MALQLPDPARPQTILHAITHHALHSPERLACKFLREGAEPQTLTYGRLQERVNAVAARLQALAQPGDRALLLYPPGLEFISAFLGCLRAGLIAVPAYPPRKNRKSELLVGIVEDCSPTVVMTTQTIQSILPPELSDSSRMTVLTTDVIGTTDSIGEPEGVSPRTNLDAPNVRGLTPPGSPSSMPCDIAPDTIAYLQYTSGSTSTPKGTNLTHGALVWNILQISAATKQWDDLIAISWLPIYHDMGLVGGVLRPLYLGGRTVLMAPTAFLQNPFVWLKALSDERGNFSASPNFGFDLCVKSITDEQKQQLDLTCVHCIANGAEPISAETVDRFVAKFADCGFTAEKMFPCYGLAEATLMATGGPFGGVPRRVQIDTETSEPVIGQALLPGLQPRWAVSCGAAASSSVVVAVDPQSRTVQREGKIGEVWVQSPAVGSGYWGNAELSVKTFESYLANGDGPFLNTGDLGFLLDGELYVTGRSKDLIIIRGRNIYPQDVERAIERALPFLAVNSCAAFSLTNHGAEKLGLLIEADRELAGIAKASASDPAAAATLREHVARVREVVGEEFEIPVHALAFVRPGDFPRTSSGKVQRHRCRELLQSGEHEFVFVSKLDRPVSGTALAAGVSQETAVEHSTPAASAVRLTDRATSATKADEIIAWLRDYATRRINSRLMDERRMVAPYVVLDFGNHGLFGLEVPQQYGGLGLRAADTFRIFEQLAGIDITLALMVGIHNALGLRPIINFGSEALKRELLPILATGRQLAAFAFTEPGAGSNMNAIGSTARAVPEGWRVNAEKRWIGLGSWAGVIILFAKAQDEAGGPLGAVALTLRDNTPGLRHGPEALTLGVRAIVQNTVHADDALVPAGDMLGRPGEGMAIAQDTMMYARWAIAAISLGGLKRCAQLMVRYADRRTVSTGRLLDNPVTLSRLQDLTSAIDATESLVCKIAGWVDEGTVVPVEAFVACKTSGPEFLGQAADQLIQLLGGRGYIETNVAPQLLRDARILRIFEGPTETLNAYLGANVLQRGESISHLLASGMQSPEVAEELRAAAEQIRQRTTELSVLGSTASGEWARSLTGELATAAILWAAIADRNRISGGAYSESVEWARLRFESLRDSALAPHTIQASQLVAQRIADRVSGYQKSIGDIEQELPGEEDGLDSFLRKDSLAPVSPPIDLRPDANARAVSMPQIGSPFPPQPDRSLKKAVHDRVVQLLRAEVDARTETVDYDAPLSSLGIDSVGMVELALNLEKDTGTHFTSEILYEYESINRIVDFLDRLHHPQALSTTVPIERAPSHQTPRTSVMTANEQHTSKQHSSAIPLEALEGSMWDFGSAEGGDLDERTDSFHAWLNLRRQERVFPYQRVLMSPAAAQAQVADSAGKNPKWFLNFGSQDYLGLAQHPLIHASAKAAIDEFGVHSAGSPVFAGRTRFVLEIQDRLAQACGKPRCLIYPTGWAAGCGVIAGLARSRDTLFIDQLAHNCLQEGVRLSGATAKTFAHNDPQQLERLLRIERERDARKSMFVILESLYSMDSDSPDLKAIMSMSRKYGAVTILDVAHDFGCLGVTGLGLLDTVPLDVRPDVIMGSFSKTFASNGGFVCCSEAIADYLQCFSSPFVFSNSISPVQSAVVKKALEIVFSPAGAELRQALMDRILVFRAKAAELKLIVRGTPSAICPVFVGSEQLARVTSRYIEELGLLANLVEFPAVPKGEARFRFQLMSTHTFEAIDRALDILVEARDRARLVLPQ